MSARKPPMGLGTFPPPRTAETEHLYDRGISTPQTKAEKRKLKHSVYGNAVKPSEETLPCFWGERLPLFTNHELHRVDAMLHCQPKKKRKPKAGKPQTEHVALDIAGNDITEEIELGRNAEWVPSDERQQPQQQEIVVDVREPFAPTGPLPGFLKGQGKKRRREADGQDERPRRRRNVLAGTPQDAEYDWSTRPAAVNVEAHGAAEAELRPTESLLTQSSKAEASASRPARLPKKKRRRGALAAKSKGLDEDAKQPDATTQPNSQAFEQQEATPMETGIADEGEPTLSAVPLVPNVHPTVLPLEPEAEAEAAALQIEAAAFHVDETGVSGEQAIDAAELALQAEIEEEGELGVEEDMGSAMEMYAVAEELGLNFSERPIANAHQPAEPEPEPVVASTGGDVEAHINGELLDGVTQPTEAEADAISVIITSEDERAALGAEQDLQITGTPDLELQAELEPIIADALGGEQVDIEEMLDDAVPELAEAEMETDPKPVLAVEAEPEAAGRDLGRPAAEHSAVTAPADPEGTETAPAAKPSKVEQWIEQVADPIETEMAPAGIDEQPVVWEAPPESDGYGSMLHQSGHPDQVRAVSPQVVVPVPSSPQVVIPRPSQEDVEYVRKARAGGV